MFAANAGDPDQAEACVAATVERFGSVDVLVNNAATNPYFGPTLEIDTSRFDKTVRGQLEGSAHVDPVELARVDGRARRRRAQHRLGRGPVGRDPHRLVYNGTKAALLHLTRSLAAEMAPGVRVNALAPGLVKTDMARVLWQPNEEALARHTPLGRLGEPQDIADAAVFLCSDRASWITGATLVVDGGALLGAS